MQKIVLFAGLEKNRRAIFRRVSRATMILIMRLGFGDEVASLSLAASTLRMSLSCPCCATATSETMFEVLWRKVRARHELVADAGAMYEAVDSRFVLVCLNVFLSTADLGYTGVAVFRTKKLHG